MFYDYLIKSIFFVFFKSYSKYDEDDNEAASLVF